MWCDGFTLDGDIMTDPTRDAKAMWSVALDEGRGWRGATDTEETFGIVAALKFLFDLSVLTAAGPLIDGSAITWLCSNSPRKPLRFVALPKCMQFALCGVNSYTRNKTKCKQQ